MAIAIANQKPARAIGGSAVPLWVAAQLTLDASYPAGGYPLAPVDFGYEGHRDLEMVLCGPAVQGGNLLIAAWDEATDKLRIYYPTGGVTAPPTTVAQPKLTAGGTTVTGSAATGPFTPGAGVEVPTAAVLTGYVIQCIAFAA